MPDPTNLRERLRWVLAAAWNEENATGPHDATMPDDWDIEVDAILADLLSPEARDDLLAAMGPARCGVNGCVSPEPPPEKWPSCFYDGSPCQRAQP